jgi:hypothetical protein
MVADDATAALVSLSSPRTLSMSSLDSRLSGTTLVQEDSGSEEGGLVGGIGNVRGFGQEGNRSEYVQRKRRRLVHS